MEIVLGILTKEVGLLAIIHPRKMIHSWGEYVEDEEDYDDARSQTSNDVHDEKHEVRELVWVRAYKNKWNQSVCSLSNKPQLKMVGNTSNFDEAVCCPDCKMWLSGPKQWEDHKIGRRHMKSTQKKLCHAGSKPV